MRITGVLRALIEKRHNGALRSAWNVLCLDLSHEYICKNSLSFTFKRYILFVCWKRLLRVPWTARRSNQSILKEPNPEYSLEGLMLKLKLQYFGHLERRAHSLEKTLMLRKIEGKRRKGWQRMRWLDKYHKLHGHESEQTPGDSGGQRLAFCCPWGHQESDTT